MAKLGITTEDVDAAKQEISEDGEFGDGFVAAKKALGGELPDICQQTYDETMRKLNDWADETDS